MELTSTLNFIASSLLIWCTVSCTLFYFIKYWHYYWLASKIPRPFKYIPASLSGLYNGFKYNFDAYKVSKESSLWQKDIYAHWFPRFTVVLKNPEYVRKFFTLTEKSIHYDGLVYLFGKTNLISSGGEDFKKSKQIFHSGFNGSSQKIILETLHRNVQKLLVRLQKEQKQAGEGWIKLINPIKYTTANSIYGSAADMSISEDHPIYTEVVENSDNLLKASMMRTNLSVIPIIGSYLNPLRKVLEKGREVMLKLSADQEAKKRKLIDEMVRRGEELPNQFIYNSIRARSDDPESIYTDVTTLTGAATDTSAYVTAATLVLLGMYPEIQEKVFQEDQIIQEELEGRSLEETDFAKYEYLHRVIKESLRLYSPIPMLARHVPNDIQFGEYTLPKGCSVAVFLPDIHRNPNIYPNPTHFDPDRFLPEQVAKRDKYNYMPFSHGQRQCPGMRYGTQSSIYMVSSVIRKFEVISKYKTVEEIDENLTGFFTISESGHFPAKLKLRNK